MRVFVVLSCCVMWAFALEFNFKPSSLESFELQGMHKKVVYKTKEDRNAQIASLWEAFLGSRHFSLDKSSDKKLYVVYTNTKANSFDCFIGIKSDKKMDAFEKTKIQKSNYLSDVLLYKDGMDMDDVWDAIQKEKLKRDFKTDIEQYNLNDLMKKAYNVTIYLSTK